MEQETVKYHLENFYNKNPEFGEDGGANEKWAKLDFGLIKIPFPNFKSRSDILYLHDLNHIINDYDTSWKGEVSVSAWEISTGIGKFWVGWFFSIIAFGFGSIVYPKACYKAFMRGRVTKSLYRMNLPKKELFEMSLAELKRLTGHESLNMKFKPNLIEKVKCFISAFTCLTLSLIPFMVLIGLGIWLYRVI